MSKQMRIVGKNSNVIIDNRSCDLLQEFNCTSSITGQTYCLNYFCWKDPQNVNDSRTARVGNLATDYLFTFSYLHIPPIFKGYYLDPGGGEEEGFSLKIDQQGNDVFKGFSGLVITEQIADESAFYIKRQMVYGKDCGELFAFFEEGNARAMIFQFNNHYFIPFVLGNGQFAYYAIEGKRAVRNWIEFIEDPSHNYGVGVSVRGPILYENILGITYTKSIYLVETEIVDRVSIAKKYYDPMTQECWDVSDPGAKPCEKTNNKPTNSTNLD
jgi:hypothetical protein